MTAFNVNTGTMPPTPPRAQVLDRARAMTLGDRNKSYGSPYDNMKDTAALWSAYLGHNIQPHEVAVCMALVKIARTKTTPDHQDSHDDAAAYMAIAYECAIHD